MSNGNITLSLRKDRSDAKGLHNIRIRWTISRKSRYINTDVSVEKNQWDGKEIINHPNKDLLNKHLRNKLIEFEKRYLEAEITGNPFTNNKSTKVDFHEYAANKCLDEKKIIGTNNKHKISTLNKFKSFAPKLYFSDITIKVMKDYEQYCRDLGNKENTIWSCIKNVKSIINAALKEGVIKSNPLLNYSSPKFKDPQRDFLTAEEVEKIENFALDIENHNTLRTTANWFLFSCYSGLRYSDLNLFKKENIINERIILRNKKTGTDVTIKIHTRLTAVISRLSNNIFSNQKINEYLKVIAKDDNIKINKPISMHIARHTFAVLYLNKGGSMEGLSKILGHTSIRVTQVYGKITNLRLDAEMDKVWG